MNDRKEIFLKEFYEYKVLLELHKMLMMLMSLSLTFFWFMLTRREETSFIRFVNLKYQSYH